MNVMEQTAKKTPTSASEFERSQLRFFLEQGNISQTLAEFNPSLAWLAEIAKMDLIQSPAELAPWIEQNFNDPGAVREVVTNINFFDERAGKQLEWALNRKHGELDPAIAESWQLIIRHIRNTPRGIPYDEWFDIGPRLKEGDVSSELFDRLVEILRPKVKVGKRISLSDEDGSKNTPETPFDLMSVDYEIVGSVKASDVLSAWPENASADAEARFLDALISALNTTLNDAVELNIESNTGYSKTDHDVPSVAEHPQNEYQTGFLPIVRVIADIWTRFARKNASSAILYIDQWSLSPLKMNNRLALFACADAAVPAVKASEVLLNLQAGLLFLTNSSVEVFRLIGERWEEMPSIMRAKIEARIVSGPPSDWFRANAERHIDRSRFDLLGDMDRSGLELSGPTRTTLEDIKKKYPHWELRPAEQAGFHIWSGGVQEIVGDPKKLHSTPVESLLDEAKRLADNDDFLDGNDWLALCQSEPQHALGGLEFNAEIGEWPGWAWNSFLWATKNLIDPESILLVGKLLLEYPEDCFPEVTASASWWLNEKVNTLDDNLFWPLWDKVVSGTIDRPTNVSSDVLMSAINDPAGRLAEVLIKKMSKSENGQELSDEMHQRFDRLVCASGSFGKLARVCLASHLSILYERAPIWTTERIIPIFDWNSPEAVDAWKARKYSKYIGSPKLFELTKVPFLELFERTEIMENDLEVYGAWLTNIIIANVSANADYPLTTTEARSALRIAGIRALTSVGHRLAIEMESAGEEDKKSKWENVVGPVFQAIWPLDAEIQSPKATFKLVQILRATGSAFPDAAKVIIPFIRSEGPHDHTSLYSISKADDVLYSSSPEKLLDLAAAVVGDEPAGSVYGLKEILERIRSQDPQLADMRKFQRLLGIGGPH